MLLPLRWKAYFTFKYFPAYCLYTLPLFFNLVVHSFWYNPILLIVIPLFLFFFKLHIVLLVFWQIIILQRWNWYKAVWGSVHWLKSVFQLQLGIMPLGTMKGSSHWKISAGVHGKTWETTRDSVGFVVPNSLIWNWWFSFAIKFIFLKLFQNSCATLEALFTRILKLVLLNYPETGFFCNLHLLFSIFLLQILSSLPLYVNDF